MPTAVSIVGQGLAGSILGWLCESAGVPFEIFDLPSPTAASRIGAGIINPITGQRWVKSWQIDYALPVALKLYRELEIALEAQLVLPYRLQRLFRSEREKGMARAKWQRGDFNPYARESDDRGIWFEPAYRIDTATLVERLKSRWIQRGRWKTSEGKSEFLDPLRIYCRGAAEVREGNFQFAGLTVAKGEIVEIETEAIDPQVILNESQWLLPLNDRSARVGATFSPGDFSNATTDAAKDALWASARAMIGEKARGIVGQVAGTRVVTLDKHPVIGPHPSLPRMGIFNGLGSKGALLAPWLGFEWLQYVLEGKAIDPSVDVARFWSRSSGGDATGPKLL